MEAIGKYIWISDEEYEWLPGKIIEAQGDKYKIEVKINQCSELRYEDRNSDFTEIHPSCLKGVDDLLYLGDFNKQTLLHNTRERFTTDRIYSFIGSPILIAVNPYKSLPIYNQEQIKHYKDFFSKLKLNLIEDQPPLPHLYHIAEAAYLDMITDKANQCIIISGESGSGKTESTKIMLKYLAVSSMHSLENEDSNMVSVEKQVLDSNPVLEAFGNAKTVRNNNSSRFGKFIQVNFTECGKILSAKIFNYLLEKSRIVKLQKEERNYHIFYQLLKGADDSEKKKFYINQPPEYFNYLNQSDCYEVEDENDKENFQITKECLSKLNFKSAEMNLMFSIIMGILYLGNVKFGEIFKNGATCADIDVSNYDFKKAADLLGVERDTLKQILTIRKMKDLLSGKYIERNLSIESAYNTRDAIAKQIYAKMFNWLVRRINDAISNKSTGEKKSSSNVKTKYIGLLDIFGFENFTSNSFEQLCINYANERLQQYFNNHIFKLEQEEYKKEKIDWSSIEFIDNIEIVNLIDDKKISIFSLLDSEGLLKNCNDYTFRNKVYDNLLSKNEYIGETDEEFILIHHYAGDVYYDVQGFIEKNTDNVSNDIQEAMEKSKNKLVCRLFISDKESSSSGSKGNSNKIQSDTLSKQFKKQLDELLTMLSQSNPRYVKCIKPNSLKKPKIFDSFQVGDQLLSAGVLEAIKIRRQGFSIRRTLNEFCNRYQKLTPMIEFKNYFQGKEQEIESYRNICSDMLKILSSIEDLKHVLDPSKKLIQVGITKLFMKEEVKNALEFKLNRIKFIIRLQNSFRNYKVKKKLKFIKYGIKTIARIFKGCKFRKEFKRIRKVIKIQRFYRHYKLKKVIMNKLKRLVIEAKKAKMKEEKEKNNKVLNENIKQTNVNQNISNMNLSINSIEMDSTRSKDLRNLSDINTSTMELANALKDMNFNTIIKKDKLKKKQSHLKDLTSTGLSSINNFLDSELTSQIVLLNEELNVIKAEKERLKSDMTKYKECLETKEKSNEVLEEKLKHMKSIVMRCEEEISEMNTKLNDSNKNKNKEMIPENEKLKEENSTLKRRLGEKETEIEILNLNLNEANKSNLDLTKLNSSLKDQISRRKEKEEKEVGRLYEEVNSLQKEKLDLETKLKETLQSISNNSLNNSNSSFLSNYTTTNFLEKDISDYKKQVSHLKTEIKNINKKYDEYRSSNEIEIEKLKSELIDKNVKINELSNKIGKNENQIVHLKNENKEISELNKKLKDLTIDQQAKITKLEKNSENANELNKSKLELDEVIRSKDMEIRDLGMKIEDSLQLVDRHSKMEQALKNELKLKEIEIGKRNEIIKEIQEEVEKLGDENIIFKKENFNLKVKLDSLENDITHKYENSIKNKNQEIFILKEKEIKCDKFIVEMKQILNKKQNSLENKKKINNILVDIIKIKRNEVQTLEALRLTSSNNLKENLVKIREGEKVLLEKVDEISNNPDYTDDSEDDNEDDDDIISDGENSDFNSSKEFE